LKNDIYSYIEKARSSVKEAENIGSINTVDKGVGSDDTGAAAD
jgi:exo-beta-1,3-glucanase (GH17 family)